MTSPAFGFDRLTESHLPMLREWLARDHVAQWWGEADPIAELRSHYALADDRPSAPLGYIASLGEEPIGFVRAIRCYAAAGFRIVRPVDTPDGPALLMRCTRESLPGAASRGQADGSVRLSASKNNSDCNRSPSV